MQCSFNFLAILVPICYLGEVLATGSGDWDENPAASLVNVQELSLKDESRKEKQPFLTEKMHSILTMPHPNPNEMSELAETMRTPNPNEMHILAQAMRSTPNPKEMHILAQAMRRPNLKEMLELVQTMPSSDIETSESGQAAAQDPTKTPTQDPTKTPCQDLPSPRWGDDFCSEYIGSGDLDCSAVLPAGVLDPAWQGVTVPLAQICPKTCGTCTTGPAVGIDQDPYCRHSMNRAQPYLNLTPSFTSDAQACSSSRLVKWPQLYPSSVKSVTVFEPGFVTFSTQSIQDHCPVACTNPSTNTNSVQLESMGGELCNDVSTVWSGDVSGPDSCAGWVQKHSRIDYCGLGRMLDYRNIIGIMIPSPHLCALSCGTCTTGEKVDRDPYCRDYMNKDFTSDAQACASEDTVVWPPSVTVFAPGFVTWSQQLIKDHCRVACLNPSPNPNAAQNATEAERATQGNGFSRAAAQNAVLNCPLCNDKNDLCPQLAQGHWGYECSAQYGSPVNGLLKDYCCKSCTSQAVSSTAQAKACFANATVFPGVANADFLSFEGNASDTSVRLRDENVPQSSTGTFDLTGWTPERVVSRLKSTSTLGAHSGEYFIALYNIWGGSISTSLTGMEVGAEYQVTWFERSRPGTGTGWQASGLTVLTDGCSSLTGGQEIMASHLLPDDWAQKSAVFKATNGTTELCFATPLGDPDGAAFLDGIRVYPLCCRAAATHPRLCGVCSQRQTTPLC